MILISDWSQLLKDPALFIITAYLIAIQFTLRSNTPPDCLQFFRLCVAKTASVLHTDFIP